MFSGLHSDVQATDASQLHHTTPAPGPTPSPPVGHPPPLLQQVTDLHTRAEELKLSMPPALVLDSAINTGGIGDTQPSKHVHASADHSSIHSSLFNHGSINTWSGTLNRNQAVQRYVGYAAPSPAGPLSWVYDAQQLSSGAGAVGQAATPTWPLSPVATRDSVTNYDTGSSALVAPTAGASAQVRQSHLGSIK